jgi:hypothetical protein
MNLEKNPTVDELRALLRTCNDRAGHHILWVAKNGEVHLSQVPKDKSSVGFQEPANDMRLRYETFEAGNEYVGPDAAEDEKWVNELFASLVNQWPAVKNKTTVEYVDQL